MRRPFCWWNLCNTFEDTDFAWVMCAWKATHCKESRSYRLCTGGSGGITIEEQDLGDDLAVRNGEEASSGFARLPAGTADVVEAVVQWSAAIQAATGFGRRAVVGRTRVEEQRGPVRGNGTAEADAPPAESLTPSFAAEHALFDEGTVDVTEDDGVDGFVGEGGEDVVLDAIPPEGAPGQGFVPGDAGELAQAAAMPVDESYLQAAAFNYALEREVEVIVVAANSGHGCDGGEGFKGGGFANVAGVEDEIDAAQAGEECFVEVGLEFRHMGIGDDADAVGSHGGSV